MTRRTTALLVMLPLLAGGCAGNPGLGQPERAGAIAQHVVVISIDGLRPDAIAASGAANLQRMMREGAYSLQARTIMPSRTLPSHTSMLTGVTPFVANNTPSMLMKHVSELPAPISRHRRDAPPDLSAAIMARVPADAVPTPALGDAFGSLSNSNDQLANQITGDVCAMGEEMGKVATEDLGLSVFLNGWIASFYLGLLLVALALFLSKKTPPWVPALLVIFVLLFPFAGQIGRVGQVMQVMALAVAFTGVAIAAVNQVNRVVASRQPSY